MEYYRNVEDGTVKAVEHGSDAEKALLAQKTTPDSRTGQTFPLYESVTTPGAPAADISGVPDWAVGQFSEGALVKYGGKLYIAKGAVAADAAAPDTDTGDWDLIGPSPPSGGSGPAVPGIPTDVPVADLDNLGGVPDAWADLEKYQLPEGPSYYLVQVSFKNTHVSQDDRVYIIRNEAHWNDFWLGAGDEPTQAINAGLVVAANPAHTLYTTGTLVALPGWYVVGRARAAGGVQQVLTIPFAPI